MACALKADPQMLQSCVCSTVNPGLPRQATAIMLCVCTQKTEKTPEIDLVRKTEITTPKTNQKSKTSCYNWRFCCAVAEIHTDVDEHNVRRDVRFGGIVWNTLCRDPFHSFETKFRRWHHKPDNSALEHEPQLEGECIHTWRHRTIMSSSGPTSHPLPTLLSLCLSLFRSLWPQKSKHPFTPGCTCFTRPGTCQSLMT